jgi:hypothetical protein
MRPNVKQRLPTETRYGAHMDIGQYGDLNTLQWVENEFDPSPDMLHCEVVYGESTASFSPCKPVHAHSSLPKKLLSHHVTPAHQCN